MSLTWLVPFGGKYTPAILMSLVAHVKYLLFSVTQTMISPIKSILLPIVHHTQMCWTRDSTSSNDSDSDTMVELDMARVCHISDYGDGVTFTNWEERL